ncbi:MAG: rhomboid family intrarane serine protease, partial [Solirubrobacteraceae bacterium]|nr:rhomboid family intrarane serine protease [Solirubrobacteraceae bacterium]
FPLKDNIPTDRPALVTYVLIAANVLVYFLWQKGGLSIGSPSGQHYLLNLYEHGLVPYNVTHPGKHCAELQSGALTCNISGLAPTWTTPFTAMFMHGGLLHLGGNMLFLWIFGNNVEDSMGKLRFIAFYVLGGLAAFALQILVGPSSAIPNLGASGAIAAVLGGYILLYPRARVLTFVFIILFFTVIELPAFVVLGLWFAEQVAFGATGISTGGGSGGGVAYFAHIGGFAFGLLLIHAFARRVKQAPPRLPAW